MIKLEYNSGTWGAVNQGSIPAHSQGGRTTVSDNQTREITRLHIIHRNGSNTDSQFP